MIKEFKSISEFQSIFKDEQACRKYFEEVRFRNGDYCPHCKHDKIMRFKDGKRYRCSSCKQDFTIKTGTLFGESKLPLKTWFTAIYLLTSNKKGISSLQLSEFLGVSQKTAWYIDHRIREAMKQNNGKLFGTVEVDETYIGGKEKNKHYSKRTKHTQGRSVATKTPIVGLVQRGGEIRATVVDRVSVANVEKQILSKVEKGSTIYTDDFLGYKNIKNHFNHGVVSHGKYEYVRGQIHSNSAESFWALFKRGYMGTYHSMSKKHLQRYVDEFVYRFNRQFIEENGGVFADMVRRVAKSDKLSYKNLTA
jgi:transposase-like protein